MQKKDLYNFLSIIVLFSIPIEPLIGKVYYYLKIIFIVFFLLNVLFNKKKYFNFYYIIFLIFVFLSATSIFYSGHRQSSISMTIELFTNTFLSMALAYNFNKCNNVDEFKLMFNRMMKSFTNGTFLITLYLLIIELPKMGKWGRLGESLYLNYGSYMVYSYCGIICICYLIYYIFFYKDASTKSKIFYLCLLIILLIGVFASGTRKSVICPVIFVIFLLFISYRKSLAKMILSFSMIIIIVFFGYSVMMNNKKFYNRIGVRIENMIQQIDGNTKEGSITERTLLRNLSIDLFKERPIMGYGIHAFRYYSYYNGGPYLYSHCNYTELLADLGIIGFLVYYIGYFYLIHKSYTNLNKYCLSDFILPFLLMNLFSDYGSVIYYRHYYLIVFFMIAKYYSMSDKKFKIIEGDTVNEEK